MMKIPRRWLSIIAIAAFFSGVILGSNAAGQAPNRVEVKTISLGIVSEARQKEIEEHYRDFVGYLARKLSSPSGVEAKVIVASTPPDLAKLLGQQRVDFYMESAYGTYIINDVEGAGKLLLRRWQRGKPEYQSLIFHEKKQRHQPPE
jgi:ABC-type phosphate/phosphonate transport system substrate-binding protein